MRHCHPHLLQYKQRRHHDLDITNHGLTLWDLDREFPTGGFGGKPVMKLRHILGVLRDAYCRTVGIEVFRDFAEIAGTELLVIDEDTTVRGFQQEIRWNQAYYRLAQGL